MFLTVLAAATLLFYLAVAVVVTRGNRSIARLECIAPFTDPGSPAVSLVVAARDEETHIEEALASMLGQDYPTYEVIVVDDRSTDRTAEILERMTRTNTRLRVFTVRELPSGWLGKNHALHYGASRASGQLLVFTDADVVMHPSVLGRAVRYALDNRLDHLAIPPQVRLRGFLLNAFLPAFGFLFTLYAQPWKARDPKSARHIGIGAFNLVRTSVYRAIGGHQPIAMRPDDDMKLGKLIKRRGYRQDIVLGTSLLSVEWYAGVGDMTRGLMKNMFAGVGYSVPAAVAAAIAQLVLCVWPFVAIAAASGAPRALNALVVLVMYCLLAANSTALGLRRLFVLAFPLGVLMFVYLLLRSMVTTLARGGIDWRGTHYPLSELRKNRA